MSTPLVKTCRLHSCIGSDRTPVSGICIDKNALKYFSIGGSVDSIDTVDKQDLLCRLEKLIFIIESFLKFNVRSDAVNFEFLALPKGVYIDTTRSDTNNTMGYNTALPVEIGQVCLYRFMLYCRELVADPYCLELVAASHLVVLGNI